MKPIVVVSSMSRAPFLLPGAGWGQRLGHPIGASGARMLTTLMYALRARGGGRGVASLCIGGGMGIALIVRV